MKPTPPLPHVTVVVCTRNRPDMVVDVLDALLNNTYPAFRVLVVDQSTDERTREIVSRYQQESDIVDCVPTTTVGIPVSRNIGLINASKSGEIIAFTDDDCRVPKDWISKLAGEFVADPELDALLGRILPLKDKEGAVASGTSPSKKRGTYCKVPNPLFVNLFMLGGAANFALRSSTWQDVGAFDEGLGRGEDIDYFYRLLQKGKKLTRAPEVLVYHRVRRTQPEDDSLQIANHEAGGEVIAKHWLLGSKGSRLYALSRIWIYVLRPFLHGLVCLSPQHLRKSRDALQATRRGIRIAKERYQVAK